MNKWETETLPATDRRPKMSGSQNIAKSLNRQIINQKRSTLNFALVLHHPYRCSPSCTDWATHQIVP